jgi:hypothetical protein
VSGDWLAAFKVFGPLFAGMFIMFIMLTIMVILGGRWITRDKIACTFHKNHKKAGALLKYDAINGCVWLGKEDDPNREKYLVTEDEMEWLEWPGMLPHIMSVTIRSLDYVRGVPTPLHPEKKVSTNISAKSLRLQSDGNVLQAVYMHARNALGLNKKQALGGLVTVLLVATAAVSLFDAYKSMQIGTDTAALKNHIQLIENALHIDTSPAANVTPGTPLPGGR